ncbi:MAG: DUF484 family protein [Azospirillum sp.]|nr:DUF484 family protein [Azospirillum sp.]
MAREQSQSQRLTGTIGAEEVSAYLRAHPDFLAHNAELVEHLTPPMIEHGQGVVDFQYFLVERLRGEVDRLRGQQRELIATTRANINCQARVHAAALFLLDAQSFEHLIQTVTTDLAVLLDLDIACLIVESNGQVPSRVHNSGVRVVDPGSVDRWLGRKDAILRCNIIGDSEIFGGGAGLVRSEALIRLRVSGATPQGLLAFGSRDGEMFHHGQGTELVSFLARIVERCIRTWLELPA